jgi:transcriptional regulator with XRE-family HTH domain
VEDDTNLIVGRVLRRARRSRGFTLHDVFVASSGEFKSSSLAGYERGERHISLERFIRIAHLYQEKPEVLMAEISRASKPVSGELVIDLTRLSMADDSASQMLDEFVAMIQAERGETASDVIAIRTEDLAALALRAGVDWRTIIDVLRPVLR